MDAPSFRGKRIKVKLSGTLPLLSNPGWKGEKLEGRSGLWVGLEEEGAKVVFGLHETALVPGQYIVPTAPSLAGEKVVVLRGPHYGKQFSTVSCGPLHCTVCKPGTKGMKNAISILTSDLAIFC